MHRLEDKYCKREGFGINYAKSKFAGEQAAHGENY